MVLLTDKGNWKNYYGYDARGIHEVVKIRGRYYFAKLIIWEWLIPQGNPIKEFTFSN